MTLFRNSDHQYQYVGHTDGGAPTSADGSFVQGNWCRDNDEIFVCVAPGTPGQWESQKVSGTSLALVSGLDATGTTDNTTLIQASLNAGRGIVTLPANGTFKVGTLASLTIPNGVVLDLNGSTLNNANAAGLPAVVTAAATRSSVFRNGQVTGVAGSGAPVKITADFGGVQLVNLILEPVAGASGGVDATAGNGIDLFMQDVRVNAAAGVTCFALSAALAANTLTAINCYAQGGAIGWDIYNWAGWTLIGPSADNTTGSGYQLGGNGRIDTGTCENGSGKGVNVVGGGRMRLEMACVSQADPFYINAGADVDLVCVTDTGTPSTNSLTLTASATAAVTLGQHSFSKAISVNAAARLDQAVTVAGIKQAKVSTSETTGSSSYADLATVGPVVTATIGVSGLALVIVSAYASNASAGGIGHVGIDVSGATTVAANDSDALEFTSWAADAIGQQSVATVLSGLTPGANTFTLKYRANVNTATFKNRRIVVIPL